MTGRPTRQEQLKDDPRFAERLERIKHQDDLIEILTPVFRTRTRDDWLRGAAGARGAAFRRPYDADEAL